MGMAGHAGYWLISIRRAGKEVEFSTLFLPKDPIVLMLDLPIELLA